jgi:hypothetical protein
MSTSGSSIDSHTLGLGIAPATNAPDPIIASLMSAQHNNHQSHLFLVMTQGDFHFGLPATLQGSASDDGYSGVIKCPRIDDSASALYWKGNPETFHFDIEHCCGPDSFFFFSVLL